jgi:hypothetical protein
MSYDLGVQGDYEGLYEWLDAHGALECGDSFAIVKYQFRRKLLEELRKELHESVEFTKRSRIYVVYKADDGSTKGVFLVGRRKASPWEGAADTGASKEDE